MLRRKGRNSLELHLHLGVAHRIPDGENARVKHPDDIPGVRLLDNFPVLGHHLLGLRQLDALALLHVQVLGVLLEFPGADAHKCNAVAVVLIHIRLNFEHKGGKALVKGVHHPVDGLAGQRGRRHLQKVLQKGLHAEVGQRRPEEHRAQFTVAHLFYIKFIACAVQKLDVIHQRLPLIRPQQLIQPCGIGDVALDGRQLILPVVELIKGQNLPAVPVEYPLEIHAAADGPVHRVGADAEFLFQLLQKVEGVAGLTVQLIDKGKDGDIPHGAHLKELAGLRLYALCRINDHHGAVRRHQGAVGVLAEVLVSGGIQYVDAEPLVFKLHHRAGDRNTALFFDLHPVGDRMARGLFALHRARQLNGPAVKQEFFGQRGLTGIGVGDNGEGPPPADFLFECCHSVSSFLWQLFSAALSRRHKSQGYILPQSRRIYKEKPLIFPPIGGAARPPRRA